jgi:hypothetical protein
VNVAFGWKAHSGWSALVVLGSSGGAFEVIERRRVELVEAEEARWAKQPYHAAEGLEPREAQDVVKRGIDSARRAAILQTRAAVTRSREAKHDVVACAVLIPEPMLDWSTDEILAVHFRMHKAEGVLFPDALCRAAQECGLVLVAIPEKRVSEHAQEAFAISLSRLMGTVATLGRSVGPPWGKDQKHAALAAMIALRGLSK